MDKNRIIFRADGNVVAGYGHVIRALSLASILKAKYRIVFIIQKTDAFLKEQIKNTCDELIEIPVSKNSDAEAKKIATEFIRSNDIVILDGYGFDLNYQLEVKEKCFKLVCIDDIYDRSFAADVVINHSEGIKPMDYSIEQFSKLYLGTQYAILRSSFLKKQKLPSLKKTHKAFINMGGTDQQNFSKKALSVCLKNKTIQSIDIVIGSFYPHKNELNEIIKKNKHTSIAIHHNLSEEKIHSLMKKSSVAICSASTISYEYASVGGFLFVYQTVLNQKNIYKFLIRSKIAYPLASFNTQLSKLQNSSTAPAYFKNRNTYFSGNSKKNLSGIFDNLEKERGLTLRRANSKDVLTYFKWANDTDVRKNSVSTEPILFADHKSWFDRKLKNENAVLYILEKNGIPLGQVRLDRTNTTAEIDYSIAKKYRGKGYGEIILKKSIQDYYLNYPNDLITAKAKVSNMASNRVFEKLGFKRRGSSVAKGIRYSSYSVLRYK